LCLRELPPPGAPMPESEGGKYGPGRDGERCPAAIELCLTGKNDARILLAVIQRDRLAVGRQVKGEMNIKRGDSTPEGRKRAENTDVHG